MGVGGFYYDAAEWVALTNGQDFSNLDNNGVMFEDGDTASTNGNFAYINNNLRIPDTLETVNHIAVETTNGVAFWTTGVQNQFITEHNIVAGNDVRSGGNISTVNRFDFIDDGNTYIDNSTTIDDTLIFATGNTIALLLDDNQDVNALTGLGVAGDYVDSTEWANIKNEVRTYTLKTGQLGTAEDTLVLDCWPTIFNTYELKRVDVSLGDTTGVDYTTVVKIYNLDQAKAQNSMLTDSITLSVDQGDTTYTAINATYDDMLTREQVLFKWYCTGGSTTLPKGLYVSLEFRKP
jgi:hypothetical protein